MLKEQANALGINNPFYTWYGKDHVPYASSAAYMDSTVNFVRDFLVTQLGCTDPALIPQNTPAQTATLFLYNLYNSCCKMTCATPGVVIVNELTKANVINSVFPNPSDNEMTIEFANSNTTHKVELFDVSGKIIYSENTETNIYNQKK
jgi:para-nitrobenzyl esterase